MSRMRKVNRDQKLLKQAIDLSIMALVILFQIALIVVCRGNSGSIMDLENQIFYIFYESMCFAKTSKHPHLYLKVHQHYPDLILSQYLSEYEGYMRRMRKDFTFPSLKEYIETKSDNVKEESIDNVV